MARIDQTVIEEIKLRANIEDVISSYVQLKRAGSNYQGLCPFHSEKSPSFTVFPGTSSFYCFGCGAGGDVIHFIRRAENMDYPSAIEFLAKRVGVPITMDKREQDENARRERVLAMNKEAARFFHQKLFAPEGAEGLRYLTEVRRLPMPLIRHFGLGFAPNEFGALTNHLRKKGYTDSEMSSAFLCGISQKTGKPYDYFRNRVIFPIIDVRGDVVAFGGRVMDDSKPKYLNSSDTPAFKKSRNLFALNFARKSETETMILCEGYMDVIALHGAGFSNAVATLGTAITSEQARIFSRYAKKVVICYDADEAGQRAASKAFALLGEVGVECRILKVEDAKDPDEYIRKFGAPAFKNLLERSRSEFDFKLDKIIRDNPIVTPDGKIKALEESVRLIASFPSAAAREIYLHRIAELLNVTPDSIRRDVEKLLRNRDKKEKREEAKQMIRQSEGYGDRINPDYVKNTVAASEEETILVIMLLHPEIWTELQKSGETLTVDDFFTAFGKKVFESLEPNLSDPLFEPGMLGEVLSVEEMDRVASIRRSRSLLQQNTITVLRDSIDRLREATTRREMSIEDILNKKRQKNGN
ncbi:MAG: DNA primase [Clostridia bacterium]|nr:DNA primase [Clostridia bacterium]